MQKKNKNKTCSLCNNAFFCHVARRNNLANIYLLYKLFESIKKEREREEARNRE
jgi:hypothetical protein